MADLGPGTDVPPRTRQTLALSAGLWLLRLLTAAGLAVDAYVHADLASNYHPATSTIGQDDLFRIEAAAAALAALLLLLFGTRPLVWAYALLVAAAGLAAVLLYRYVDVGTVGPLPDMYEPLWYREKTASAVAETAATLTAAAGLLLARHRRRRLRAADGPTRDGRRGGAGGRHRRPSGPGR
ncbi:hypothetical protein [Streptomyces cellulosae]|uniref:hypothetical protein n=1 Tax=Streptomyces cellulosae TaxID=1968 RepID=UPI0007C7F9C4|nr:hypothetical protein [Streptomyces cellulosae]